jgi:hypothetical protein
MPGNEPEPSRTRPDPSSTVPASLGIGAARRGARLRAAGMVVVALIVGAAAAGLFDVRTRFVSATSPGGLTVTVEYAAMSRGGLATPWEVTIERDGGFDAPITVATTSDYLAAFDENGLDPDPAAATSDATMTIWEFEPPDDGDTMVVTFDARLEPAVQWRRQGTTQVEAGDDTVAVSFTTWVMP